MTKNQHIEESTTLLERAKAYLDQSELTKAAAAAAIAQAHATLATVTT